MKTKADIEAYLLQTGSQFQEVDEGMWVIRGSGDVQLIVLKLAPPVLVCRVHVMNVPDKDREECFRTLLELNADIMHGAYALEGDKVVILDALQLENLDFNEFQATVDDMGMAVTKHYPRLSQLVA